MEDRTDKDSRQGMMPQNRRVSEIQDKSFLKAAIDASRDILWVIDSEMRVRAFNRSAEDYFKTHYEALLSIGEKLDALLPEDVFRTYRNYFRHVIGNGHLTIELTETDESSLIWHFIKYEENGEFLAVAVCGRLRALSGKCLNPCDWVEEELEKRVQESTDCFQKEKTVLCEAITNLQLEREEQERIEKLLVEAMRKAYSASAAKSGFLASMSHEIRTSINAVIGNLYLMKSGGGPQGQAALLQRAQKAAENLLEIINDILDFSKIEADAIVLELKPCSIRKVVCDVEEILAQKVQEKGLSLEVSMQMSVADRMLGDEVKLRQILLNLAYNAVKFTDSGYVRLKARILPLDCERVMAIFEVEDSGIGMTAEQISNLFIPFRQGPEAFDHTDIGSGLGLYICHRLVTLMGGSIQVYSEPDRGSCFIVNIPSRILDVRESEDTLSAEKDAVDLSGYKVLVVDDNEVNREVLSDILKTAGALVDSATDGMDALSKAVEEEAYDLMLLDIHMPVVDGYEVARTLRKNGSNLPIIAVTADVLQGVIERSHAAGFDGYLSKPVKPEELFTLIAELVGDRRKQHGERFSESGGQNAKEDFYHSRWAHLENLPGLNVQSAMARLEGHKNMYHKVLIIFLNTQIWTPFEMRYALSNQEPKAAAALAHRLKGAAASIGAQQAAETAALLQAALEEGVAAFSVGSLIDQLEADLIVVKNAIIAVLRRNYEC